MKLASTQSLRQNIISTLGQCRQKTLDLLAEIELEGFYRQVHPDFSPIGWHFGHIASVEAHWILEDIIGLPPFFPEYRLLFTADGLPKAERQCLPSRETIQNYLARVRQEVLNYLQIAPIETEERLWRWLVQHESQHNEIILFLWQLYRQQHDLTSSIAVGRVGSTSIVFNQNISNSQYDFSVPSLEAATATQPNLGEMVEIPAGEFIMGSNEVYAQDNERPAHTVNLKSYWIERFAVTCQQYQEFMQAGGYQNRNYWSEAGWQWLQVNPVSQPLHWSDAPEWQNHPVCGVNYYEAEAYANFVGKRLPTEAEWEKAASLVSRPKTTNPLTSNQQNFNKNSIRSVNFDVVTSFQKERDLSPMFPPQCNHDNLIGHTTPVNSYPNSQSAYGCHDMLGNVWEWTASWFQGYPGFISYLYQGYSQVYFDNQHRVLRGGSWATRPWALRTSFRNWYHPDVRQILAGFRCAADGSVA